MINGKNIIDAEMLKVLTEKSSSRSNYRKSHYRNTKNVKLVTNKKGIQLNANCLLSDSPCFLVNKLEHVLGRWVSPCTVMSKLNKYEQMGWGGEIGTLYSLPLDRQNNRHTFPLKKRVTWVSLFFDTSMNVLLYNFIM